MRTVLPEPLAPLGELAANLRWVWDAQTRAVFAAVDERIWEAVDGDPVRLLGEVSVERLNDLRDDAAFLRRLGDAAESLRTYLTQPRWYQSLEGAPAGIAYFSAEYGITSALPQYSGGLGILAGDHLKTASDLGVPVIGVGLLYRHGYFSQSLSREGWQLERYPTMDPGGSPMSQLREADGSPVRVELRLPGDRTLVAHVWKAQVGRVPLLLLDAGHEGNDPALRDVTDRLYGGTTDHRLRQELLLGVGGVRAVRAYCRITGAPEPEVFHMNEGHAGFLGLERIREFVTERGLSFEEALEAARAGTVFTTHTPVPAGIDRFPRGLVLSHFTGDGTVPDIPVERIMALGTEDYPGGDPELFNMAVMGMRLAQRVNGVSLLHGAVSRRMFHGLWPGFDLDEVPITSVTNGVHAATWVADEAMELAQRTADPRELAQSRGWEQVREVSEKDLWDMRRTLRQRLVLEARRRLRASWKQRGATDAELGWIDDALDPDVLTIGFARRVPSYKRLTLMLRDRDRLKAMLLHPERPIQLVIAGKAHPADEGGKRLIQEIVRFSDDPEVRHRIVFLPDYDMALARVLVQGADVWLNNPLRPLEACGTSGMKVALNGGLNLSILDGWWDEWFDGSNGWAIPSADGIDDPDRRDALEASALYDLVGEQVAELFYDRDGGNLPSRWLEMVKHTLASLGPKVLATRMLRDYVSELYGPAAESARRLTGPDTAPVRELAAWKQRVVDAWPGVRIEHVEVAGVDAPQVGERAEVHASVRLGGLSTDDVSVEAVFGRVGEGDGLVKPARVALEPVRTDDSAVTFAGEMTLDRAGAFGYTVRVVPRHELLSGPAELGLVAYPEEPAGMLNGNLR
ncbi:starch phosphorylase [Allonocardiopsis opalescens]|uniref:glycogen phosphorylase n=1 Tax=Allonocardiopsis opalescens TaxID=1144618 RepID=A0A2T0QE14_9ACTN|nr:starch phosphorylase [Allonocardiopsis opalescens]